MVIKEIKITNFGTVECFKARFNSSLNLVNVQHVNQITAAINFLLCSSEAEVQKKWIRQNTCITARVLINKDQYFVKALPDRNMILQLAVKDVKDNDLTKKYKCLLSRCAEQDTVDNFNKSYTLPMRLCWYKDREEYDFGDLSAKTNGIADTKFFRAYLNKFIKNFNQNTKNIYVPKISDNGRLEPINADKNNEKTFLYNCYLLLAEFWDELEKIRNIHYESKPLIVGNFIKNFDQMTEVDKTLKETLQTKKQVIMLG